MAVTPSDMPNPAELSPVELDAVYTGLCSTLTGLGQAQAPLFLARLAMLALSHIGDADVAQSLIAAAAQDLSGAA